MCSRRSVWHAEGHVICSVLLAHAWMAWPGLVWCSWAGAGILAVLSGGVGRWASWALGCSLATEGGLPRLQGEMRLVRLTGTVRRRHDTSYAKLMTEL